MSSSMPLSESRKKPASSPAISAEGGTRKRRWRSSWVGRSALSEFASRTHIKLSYLVGVGGGQTYAKEHLITFTVRNGILLNKLQWGDIAKYCKAQVRYVIVFCSLPPALVPPNLQEIHRARGEVLRAKGEWGPCEESYLCGEGCLTLHVGMCSGGTCCCYIRMQMYLS